MTKSILERVIKEAKYIIKNESTVREMAKIFKVSKSTVHKDLHERLKDIDLELYDKVSKILIYHTDIRHIRGGIATREKYLNL